MKKIKIKKIAIICTIVVVVLAVGIGVYQYNKIQTYNNLIKASSKYMDLGDYDKAIALFNQSLIYKKDLKVENSIKLAKNLKGIKLIYDEGIKLMNDKKNLEAISQFSKVSKQDSKLYNNAQKNIKKCTMQLIASANDAIKNNKLDEAKKELDEILKIDPNNEDAKKLKDTLSKVIKDQKNKALAKQKQQDNAKKIVKQEAVSAKKSLSKAEAVEIVKNHFKYKASNVKYYCDSNSQHDGEDFYVVHIYEDHPTHTATLGWYGVQKSSGRIYDEMFSKYVN